MTSPDPTDAGRAPWQTTSDDDVSLDFSTTALDSSFDPTSDWEMSIDRLALALLLMAVFVAVPLGLLVLQAP